MKILSKVPLALALTWIGLAAPTTATAASAEPRMRLAFVLLSEARYPKAEDVVQAFPAFEATERLVVSADPKKDAKKPTTSDPQAFELSSGGAGFVALVSAPVPDSEANDAARFSVSSLGTAWKPPAHKAHLIVTFLAADDERAVVALSRFTSFLAAVTQASPSVGVYWGDAAATHDPKFFVETAKEPSIPARVLLWTGLSVVREPGGRLSLLSLGMRQLDLPDLLLLAPPAQENDALALFFDLLGYVAGLGKPLPEGDTVGRTDAEKLSVHYVPSPIDPQVKVWRVEMGGE
jgi:hypothetical protein